MMIQHRCRAHAFRSLALHVAAALPLLVPVTASGQTLPNPFDPSITGSQPSSIQSPVRPFGLSIVNPVQRSGSDAIATNFNTNVLPTLRSTISAQLPERVDNSAIGPVDPTKLTLDADYALRVYFVSEGAANRNTLGFNTVRPTTDGDIRTSPDARVIFPNASDPNGFSGGGVQNLSNPLNPGDFVNLGTFTKGTRLDFFIISNGATSPQLSNTYSTDPLFNPGDRNQAVSLAPLGSSYLLIGFEDILVSGGDRDMNDLVFAVEFVKVVAPEPSLAAGSLLVGCLALVRRRRN